jgi:hypothetical protein
MPERVTRNKTITAATDINPIAAAVNKASR